MSELEIDYGDGAADSDQDERISLGGFDDSAVADIAPPDSTVTQDDTTATAPHPISGPDRVDSAAGVTKPDLGLVGNTDWIARESQTFGGVYYANVKTNVTVWEKPKEVEDYEKTVEAPPAATANESRPAIDGPIVLDRPEDRASSRRSNEREQPPPRRDNRSPPARGEDRRGEYREDRMREGTRSDREERDDSRGDHRDGRDGPRYREDPDGRRQRGDRGRPGPRRDHPADTLNTRREAESYRPAPRRQLSPDIRSKPQQRPRSRTPPFRNNGPDRRRSSPRPRGSDREPKRWEADSYVPSRQKSPPARSLARRDPSPPRDADLPRAISPPRNRGSLQDRSLARDRETAPIRRDDKRDEDRQRNHVDACRQPPPRARSISPRPRQRERDVTPRYDSHGQRRDGQLAPGNRSPGPGYLTAEGRHDRRRDDDMRKQQEPPPPLPADAAAAKAYGNMRRQRSDQQQDLPPPIGERRTESERRAELKRRLELERERQHSPPRRASQHSPPRTERQRSPPRLQSTRSTADDDMPSGMLVNPDRLRAVQLAEEEARRQNALESASRASPQRSNATDRGNKDAPLDAPTGPRLAKLQAPAGVRRGQPLVSPASGRSSDFVRPTSPTNEGRTLPPQNAGYNREPPSTHTPSSALPVGPRRSYGYDSYRPGQRGEHDDEERRFDRRASGRDRFEPSERQSGFRSPPSSQHAKGEIRDRRRSEHMQIDGILDTRQIDRHGSFHDRESESQMLQPREHLLEPRTRPREDEPLNDSAVDRDRPVKRRRDEDSIPLPDEVSRNGVAEAIQSRERPRTPPVSNVQVVDLRSPTPPPPTGPSSLLSRLSGDVGSSSALTAIVPHVVETSKWCTGSGMNLKGLAASQGRSGPAHVSSAAQTEGDAVDARQQTSNNEPAEFEDSRAFRGGRRRGGRRRGSNR